MDRPHKLADHRPHQRKAKAGVQAGGDPGQSRGNDHLGGQCALLGPQAAPSGPQVTHWAKMPLGRPQEHLSLTPARVPSPQPPMLTTSSPTRRLLTRMRLLRRATAGEGPTGLSGGVMVALDALLIALIANEDLLAQIFPDLMIELDKARLEADFLHFAWPRQIDAIDAL